MIDRLPIVVDLFDPRAVDPALTGAKAANLARAARAGLPVLRGFVVTTAAGEDAAAVAAAAWSAWQDLGAPPVVVRSSSTVEDADRSSMAGQFRSVLGVVDAAGLEQAIADVLASAAAPLGVEGGRPMAVLVQPELTAVCGGVLFGLDPVTGDARRCTIDVVAGAPEQVVSGTAVAAHAVLGRHGRIHSWEGPPLEGLLPVARRAELVRLARRAARAFGGRPQDVEWAYDAEGLLWLLQSRPVTATAPRPHGPRYGPGPLAETFPEALAPLEVDLWIDPLRDGIAAALDVLGVVPEHRIRSSRVVVVLGGWPAVDLDLIGGGPKPVGLRRLDPRRGARRLLGAWRTGRLRAALPLLAGDLLAAVDAELLELPPLRELDDQALLGVLDATRDDLRALHGYEVLCGMLLPDAGSTTAAGLGLRALAWARRSGATDEVVVTTDPAVLALVPPRIGGPVALPEVARNGATRPLLTDLGPREGLRLRCRWVQELGARVVEELASRLALEEPDRVRELDLDALAAAVAGDEVDLPGFTAGPPLPTMFRLTEGEQPVADRTTGDGVAASVGRAVGRVRSPSTPSSGSDAEVLVVGALVPQLAAELDRVAAIVSETGSPLSHLAILARERGVPVATGVPDARRRFPVGTRVLVDGGSGSVTIIEEAAP